MATGTAFTDAFEVIVLDLLRNVDGRVATPFVGLFTAAPGEAGGGTELSSGAYARQAITFGAAAAGEISNSGTITFPTATADLGTVTHFGIFTASTAGTLLVYDVLRDSVGATVTRTILNGDVYAFATGTLKVKLD